MVNMSVNPCLRQTDLEVGGDDFQWVPEKVNPLNGRPRCFYRADEFRVLELEEEMGVPILSRPHETENRASHLIAQLFCTPAFTPAQVQGRDWRRRLTDPRSVQEGAKTKRTKKRSMISAYKQQQTIIFWGGYAHGIDDDSGTLRYKKTAFRAIPSWL